MRFVESEPIQVTTTPRSLTQSKLDRTGGARIAMARIQVQNGPVIVSFTEPPVQGTGAAHTGFIRYAGEIFDIEGYDNLVAAQFITLTGYGATRLYVSYAQ